MIRRFENITEGQPDVYGVLMFVIAGDAPAAEFSAEAMGEIAAAGLLDAAAGGDESWVRPHNDPRGWPTR